YKNVSNGFIASYISLDSLRNLNHTLNMTSEDNEFKSLVIAWRKYLSTFMETNTNNYEVNINSFSHYLNVLLFHCNETLKKEFLQDLCNHLLVLLGLENNDSNLGNYLDYLTCLLNATVESVLEFKYLDGYE